MLKHYIKFAIRNFRSNKTIFVGSLVTLCLGALCISLLYTYIDNELSMNDFSKDKKEKSSSSTPSENQHKRQGDIYLMLHRDSQKSQWSASDPSKILSFDYTKYPEIENLVSIKRLKNDGYFLTYNNKNLLTNGIAVDSSFFKVFDFELNIGDSKNILNNRKNIILSEKFANTVFGDDDPIGKELKIKIMRLRLSNGENPEIVYNVKGI